MQFINPKGIVYGIVSMETFVLPYYHDQYLMVVLLGLFMSTLGVYLHHQLGDVRKPV